MIALNSFGITKKSEDDNTAVFEIGPLPQGYGHTLGNILRRILLSSIPGAAITAVRLEGVQHEYSSLEGLSDDVLAVILSFKNVVVASNADEPVELTVSVKGKKNDIVEVKASDIDKNSDVAVVNTDYVITKLTDNKSFNAALTVETGVGYKLPEEDKRKEISTIPVDASFSPVSLVKYSVEPTRVGQKTDLDKINLEVTTNGAMKPEEAMRVASTILNEMASHLNEKTNELLDSDSEIDKVASKLTEQDEETTTKETAKKLPIKEMGLSTRLTNALLRAGYEDLNQLEGMAEEEIINIRGLGAKSVDELLENLKENDIKYI